MNRVTKIQALNKINERELHLGISGEAGKSWHQGYTDSAWIYVGNLPYDLNEGDILAVFSQWVFDYLIKISMKSKKLLDMARSLTLISSGIGRLANLGDLDLFATRFCKYVILYLMYGWTIL